MARTGAVSYKKTFNINIQYLVSSIRNYQILTLMLSALYIPSPAFMPNAL